MHETRILRVGIVPVAVMFLAGTARAHTPGLSLADFDVHPDGQVEAQITFASADLLGGVELDRDRDGVVTPDEVSAAGDDLRAFAMEQVGVEADGASCDASFLGASLGEADGLVLHASYACPPDSAEIEATLFYLSGSLHGQTRKAIARIVAGDVTAAGVLAGDHRAIALRRPGKAHSAWHKWARLAAFGTGGVGGVGGVGAVGAVVIAFLGWRMRRWREARAAWQNRPP